MRLIVARCEVTYTGRLNAYLPESTRLLMVKADGSVLVHADAGGYKPLNWMTPPTVFEDAGDRSSSASAPAAARTGSRSGCSRCSPTSSTRWARRRRSRRTASSATCRCARREPERSSEGLRLVRREWPTDIGPVDLMCRDEDGAWVAVEIKRVGTIDAVEQLMRYLERIRARPGAGRCRGILAAQQFKPQAVTLAEARGIRCVEVDLACCAASASPSSPCSRSDGVSRASRGHELRHGIPVGDALLRLARGRAAGTACLRRPPGRPESRPVRRGLGATRRSRSRGRRGRPDPVGAAWVRLPTPAMRATPAYVDDETPELAIAVVPDRVGAGIGGALLLGDLLLRARPAATQRSSLTVRAGNPARRLYERHGFVEVGTIENRVGTPSAKMVRRL